MSFSDPLARILSHVSINSVFKVCDPSGLLTLSSIECDLLLLDPVRTCSLFTDRSLLLRDAMAANGVFLQYSGLGNKNRLALSLSIVERLDEDNCRASILQAPLDSVRT